MSLMGRLAVLLLVPLMLGAASGPSGTIAGPFGDARLGGDVEFILNVQRFPGGDKDHYRIGEWPMVEVDCYQADVLVYGELRKPYHENGALVAEFVPLGGAGSIWLTVGGAADCTATLWAFTAQGDRSALDALTFHAGT